MCNIKIDVKNNKFLRPYQGRADKVLYDDEEHLCVWECTRVMAGSWVNWGFLHLVNGGDWRTNKVCLK